jgi:hypothetical protein
MGSKDVCSVPGIRKSDHEYLLRQAVLTQAISRLSGSFIIFTTVVLCGFRALAFVAFFSLQRTGIVALGFYAKYEQTVT